MTEKLKELVCTNCGEAVDRKVPFETLIWPENPCDNCGGERFTKEFVIEP